MPLHSEKRVVPYTPKQMYDLVADVKLYPDFLPWVASVQIFNEAENAFEAELVVGASLMNQSYTSKVTLQPELNRIDVMNIKGPFRYLNNYWVFHERGSGSEIEFFLDFELDNSLLKPILQPFLNQAVAVMVGAFQQRAEQLYGK